MPIPETPCQSPPILHQHMAAVDFHHCFSRVLHILEISKTAPRDPPIPIVGAALYALALENASCDQLRTIYQPRPLM
jgi:hypothetical protein